MSPSDPRFHPVRRSERSGEGETMVNPLWPLTLRAHKAPRRRELRVRFDLVILRPVNHVNFSSAVPYIEQAGDFSSALPAYCPAMTRCRSLLPLQEQNSQDHSAPFPTPPAAPYSAQLSPGLDVALACPQHSRPCDRRLQKRPSKAGRARPSSARAPGSGTAARLETKTPSEPSVKRAQ